jgi:quinol monooxygenase YgiN
MATAPLVIVAVFHARRDAVAALLSLLEGMLSPTRAETGCQRYDLHRSIDDPAVFFFHEVWTTEDDHRRHLGTPHVRHLLETSEGLLEGPLREYRGRSVLA